MLVTTEKAAGARKKGNATQVGPALIRVSHSCCYQDRVYVQSINYQGKRGHFCVSWLEGNNAFAKKVLTTMHGVVQFCTELRRG